MKPPYDKLQARWLRRRAKIHKWLDEGMTRKQVAEKLKISRQRLFTILKQDEASKT